MKLKGSSIARGSAGSRRSWRRRNVGLRASITTTGPTALFTVHLDADGTATV
jgi:hypothetical protein